MPRITATKSNPNKSTRKPPSLNIILRDLLDKRKKSTDRTKEIDKQIIEYLRGDSTTLDYAWLQIIQTALSRSSVNFDTTHLEYHNPGQVPIIIARKDKLNSIDSSSQSDPLLNISTVLQPLARLVPNECVPKPTQEVPSEHSVCAPTSDSTVGAEEGNQPEDPTDLHLKEPSLSDNFLRFLDPTPASLYPTALKPEEIENYLNVLTDDTEETNILTL